MKTGISTVSGNVSDLMAFSTPLQEAVAEINFPVTPLLEFRAQTLFDLIGTSFANIAKFPFFLVPQDGQSAPSYAPAYRFISSDNLRLVQYGPRLLTYNRYNYSGWDNFRQEFRELFQEIIRAGILGTVERVALTYVNRMPASTPQELQGLLAYNLGITEKTVPADFLIRKVEAINDTLVNTTFSMMPPNQFSSTFSMGISPLCL
jgi:uncharacterized protein (TIGR04255 family)